MANLNNRTTALCVARISSPSQSLENQITEIHSYCNINGIGIYDTIEIKQSAFRNIIPNKLKEYIEDKIEDTDNEPGIDCMIFTDIDRFSRHVASLDYYLNVIKPLNIKLIFIRDSSIGNLITPSDYHNFRTKLSLAQLESERISQRAIESNKAKRIRDKNFQYGTNGLDIERSVVGLIFLMKRNQTNIIKHILDWIYTWHDTYMERSRLDSYNIYYNNNDGLPLERDFSYEPFEDNVIAHMLNIFKIKYRGMRNWTKDDIETIYNIHNENICNINKFINTNIGRLLDSPG